MMSMKQHVSSMAGAFRNCNKMNSIFSSPTSKVIFPRLTSIMAPIVPRKGLPKIIWDVKILFGVHYYEIDRDKELTDLDGNVL